MTSSIKNYLLGNIRFQGFFEKIYWLGLKGMNYDRGQVFATSGEGYVLNFINDKIKHKEKAIVFDVGANVGDYAAEAVKTFGKNVSIHSFEPSATAFKKLLQVQAENLHRWNFGLSSEANDSVKLYADNAGSEWGSLYPANHTHLDVNLSVSEEIKLDTLDNFCKQNNINEIDFLKIDVEGHELSVLDGADKMLAANAISYIQFEFGLPSVESRIFIRDFVQKLHNYKIFRMVRNGMVALNYHEKYELFLTSNYLAIRKDLL